ncbi:MAG: hypothetical protein ACI8W7_001339 [Gammaproteobacteria bacterium]
MKEGFLMVNNQRDQPLEQSGTHPLYAGLEQRRAFPRVRLSIPVQVGLRGGEVACAKIYNLSPDGIQLRCDAATARRIHPSGKSITDGSGPRVLIALRLKHGPDLRTHVLPCKVFYVLAETSQEIIIGLEFGALKSAQREVIDAILSASLEY